MIQSVPNDWIYQLTIEPMAHESLGDSQYLNDITAVTYLDVGFLAFRPEKKKTQTNKFQLLEATYCTISYRVEEYIPCTGPLQTSLRTCPTSQLWTDRKKGHLGKSLLSFRTLILRTHDRRNSELSSLALLQTGSHCKPLQLLFADKWISPKIKRPLCLSHKPRPVQLLSKSSYNGLFFYHLIPLSLVPSWSLNCDTFLKQLSTAPDCDPKQRAHFCSFTLLDS